MLAISAPTGSESGPSELAEQHPGLRKLARTRPEMMRDLVPPDRRHPKPPRLIIAGGAKNPIDNAQALRMKELPDVTLTPLPGIVAHAPWLKLITDQQFEPFLAWLLAC